MTISKMYGTAVNIFYISGVLCLIFAALYCSIYYRDFSRQHPGGAVL